jgi:predicted  nucleic acid-binding Zn-ribbon protein
MLNAEIDSKEDLIKIQKEAEKNFKELKVKKSKLEDDIEKLQSTLDKIENLPFDYQNEKKKEVETVRKKIIDLNKDLAMTKETMQLYSFEFNME